MLLLGYTNEVQGVIQSIGMVVKFHLSPLQMFFWTTIIEDVHQSMGNIWTNPLSLDNIDNYLDLDQWLFKPSLATKHNL